MTKDYISREAAIKTFGLSEHNGYDTITLYEVEDALEALPAADVRAVVRCEECKYCRKEDEFEYWCYGFCSPGRLVRKDDFCSHGCKNE